MFDSLPHTFYSACFRYLYFINGPDLLEVLPFCRQSQLARMTSDLCEDGGEKLREKDTPAASKASSVSPPSAGTSQVLPGPWTIPLSPVTPLKSLILKRESDWVFWQRQVGSADCRSRCSSVDQLHIVALNSNYCYEPQLQPTWNSFISWQEAETSHRPLRSPPGLSYSFRSQLDNDNMNDWLRLLLEADHAQGEVRYGSHGPLRTPESHQSVPVPVFS